MNAVLYVSVPCTAQFNVADNAAHSDMIMSFSASML
jgi:hypothetical protein